MADVGHQAERTIGQHSVQVVTHGEGGDQVVGGLQDQRGCRQPDDVLAVVGHERHSCKLLGDIGLGAAKTVRQLFAQCRLPWCAHDHRGHGAGPAKVVAVEYVEQRVDVLQLETTDIVVGVDISG